MKREYPPVSFGSSPDFGERRTVGEQYTRARMTVYLSGVMPNRHLILFARSLSSPFGTVTTALPPGFSTRLNSLEKADPVSDVQAHQWRRHSRNARSGLESHLL